MLGRQNPEGPKLPSQILIDRRHQELLPRWPLPSGLLEQHAGKCSPEEGKPTQDGAAFRKASLGISLNGSGLEESHAKHVGICSLVLTFLIMRPLEFEFFKSVVLLRRHKKRINVQGHPACGGERGRRRSGRGCAAGGVAVGGERSSRGRLEARELACLAVERARA